MQAKKPLKASTVETSVEQERGSQMLIEERRQYIVALAQQHGRVLVEELSQSLGISRITIRKDLDYLQSRGALQRTHGGALLPGVGALSDPSLQEKEGRHSNEKQRISAAAVNLVQEGQCVLLDSGTTTTAIARALKKFSHLTIITNAVNIAGELSGTDFEVLLTGGSLRKNSFSLVGPLAEDMLHDMHADILFLGVDGFDHRGGIDDAECDGVAGQSRDGEGFVDGGGGVRLDEVQSAEPVEDCRCERDPSRDHGQQSAEGDGGGATQYQHQADAGVAGAG